MAGVAGLVARGAFLTGCPLHARTAPAQTRIVAPLTIEAAHKKGAGSTKNGRDSNSKRRGVKVYGGQPVKAGGIIVRQLGTHVRSSCMSRPWPAPSGPDHAVLCLTLLTAPAVPPWSRRRARRRLYNICQGVRHCCFQADEIQEPGASPAPPPPPPPGPNPTHPTRRVLQCRARVSVIFSEPELRADYDRAGGGVSDSRGTAAEAWQQEGEAKGDIPASVIGVGSSKLGS